MKVTTVRLSDQLRREADRCREREGLTINGLISVALGEYIDRKRALASGGIVVAVPLATAMAAAEAKRARRLKARQGRR